MRYQVLICLTRVILKTKPILSVKADEKDPCCLSVVYALMVDWQLKVSMAWPGPFYTGTLYRLSSLFNLSGQEARFDGLSALRPLPYLEHCIAGFVGS